MAQHSPEAIDYDFSEIQIDSRFQRCAFEMKLVFGTWILYALISIGLSYHLCPRDPSLITFTYGIPTWFFWGEIVTSLVFFVYVCCLALFVLRDMDLHD